MIFRCASLGTKEIRTMFRYDHQFLKTVTGSVTRSSYSKTTTSPLSVDSTTSNHILHSSSLLSAMGVVAPDVWMKALGITWTKVRLECGWAPGVGGGVFAVEDIVEGDLLCW